jgi:uncharacterized protein
MDITRTLLFFNNLILTKRSKHRLNMHLVLLVLGFFSLACSLSSRSAFMIIPEEIAPPAGPTAVEKAGLEVLPAVQVEPELAPIAAVVPSAVPTVLPLALPPTIEPIPTLSPTLIPTETPQPTPTPTALPDPYVHLYLDSLVSRSYGGGDLVVESVMADNSYFTRYLIRYPSDELQIYGFMNVPKRGDGPFPVVIALHGYIDPAVYTTLDYTTHYADTLARAGYLVLHPNLRNYPPSDLGENLFRVGMAVDVLNLTAIVRQQGGLPGPLEKAASQSIGLWGHSMGGGISLRAALVDPGIRAVVLYGSMSGDEKQNFEAIGRWSVGQRGQDERAVPDDVLPLISPLYFLERMQAAVSIHHGEADQLVPLQWSLDLCQSLQTLDKAYTCFTYPHQPHTFNDAGSQIFMQRVIEFFDLALK